MENPQHQAAEEEANPMKSGACSVPAAPETESPRATAEPSEPQQGAPQEEPEGDEAPVYRNSAEKWAYACDDKKWARVQLFLGLGLGCLGGFFLDVLGRMKGVETAGIILAAVAALYLPRAVEHRLNRKMPKVRNYLAAAMGVWIVALFVYLWVTGQILKG